MINTVVHKFLYKVFAKKSIALFQRRSAIKQKFLHIEKFHANVLQQIKFTIFTEFLRAKYQGKKILF